MAHFPDVVILLPGITGSVLTDAAGNDVWAPALNTAWHAVASHGGTIAGLALASDDTDDGVTATRLVPDVSIVPGLIKIQGYTRIAAFLVAQLGLVPGANFHTLPYDWRRDNRLSAARLQSHAMRWLHDWRIHSGDDDAKLVLIGHSMGGLVARYFVECLEGWRVTRTVCTLGTPHRGSLDALGSLENGIKKGVGPLGLDLTPVLRSLTSVYQLLPIYPCIAASAGPLLRVADAAGRGLLSHVDPLRATQARAFHQDIQDAHTDNLQLQDYARAAPVLVPFVGIQQPTAQSARLVATRLELVDSWDGKNDWGDGTVPRVSATPIDFDPQKNIYAGETHGALQNADGTLVNIRGILTSATIDLRRFLTAAQPDVLTLALDDVLLPDDGPLHVAARRALGNARVDVELLHLSTATSVTATLRRDGDTGWQRGAFAVTPGTWRVTVRSDGAQPVSDMVVVAQP